MIEPARGYAVCSREGGIHVETVQRTEVGAIVNGLLLFGHRVLHGTSDAEIRRLWAHALETVPEGHVWVSRVGITVAHDG